MDDLNQVIEECGIELTADEIDMVTGGVGMGPAVVMGESSFLASKVDNIIRSPQANSSLTSPREDIIIRSPQADSFFDISTSKNSLRSKK